MLADLFTFTPFGGNANVIELFLMATSLVFGTVGILAFRDILATRLAQIQSGMNGELELIAKNNMVRGIVSVVLEAVMFTFGVIGATQPSPGIPLSWLRVVSLLLIALIQVIVAWMIIADYRTYYLLNDMIAKRVAASA